MTSYLCTIFSSGCRKISDRVGYDHGPQVPDPRAPDWLEYMDVIWEKAALAGVEEITMTPEHGPPNYQVRTALYKHRPETEKKDYHQKNTPLKIYLGFKL